MEQSVGAVSSLASKGKALAAARWRIMGVCAHEFGNIPTRKSRIAG
jgi:hypothetical protein